MGKSVAIIPAREGSKRIPKKNIKLFLDKPIIQYSIEAAQKAGVFEEIIVSTDSEEISSVATKLGAKTPFVRPREISDDHTPLADVLNHAITWLKEHRQYDCTHACLILPTAPLLEAHDLIQSFELLKSSDAPVVVPVTTFAHPIQRAFRIDKAHHISFFLKDMEMVRSNDLEQAYHDVGQFYWINIEKYMNVKRLLSEASVAYPIPRFMAQDIDTAEDWDQAEQLYQVIQSRRATEKK